MRSTVDILRAEVGEYPPAQVIIAGHAFMQNLRRGHYEIGVEVPDAERVAAAHTELALAV